jgi:sterol 3beta-glucosyltransferase
MEYVLTLCHAKLTLIVFVKIVARARMGRRGMAAAGDFVVSPHFVGFWSKLYTQRSIRYRLPISIIKAATAASSNRLQRNGLSLVLDGQGDLQFDFKTPERRDQAVQIINAAMDAQFKMALDSLSISQSIPSTITNMSSSGDDVPYPSRTSSYYATAILAPLSRTMATVTAAGDPDGLRKIMPKVINLPRGILLARPSMHFMCLTIGSRGDVQPYIALGLGLQKEGHRVTIVTHEEYKGWVEGFGIGHRTAGGDPGALMKLSVEHKVGTTKKNLRIQY